MHEFKKVPKLNQILNTYKDVNVFLWDMDGTIMHTEILHAKAILGMLKKKADHTGNRTEITNEEIHQMEEQCIGLTDSQVYQKIKPFGVVDHLTEKEFLELKNKALVEDIIPTVKSSEIFNLEVKELMDEISAKGFKQAVVTSSEKAVTFELLNHLDLKDKFDFIITREDTEQNKPNPAPYLHALKKCGSSSKQVIIFEDSKAGIAAAEGAGANVIKASWYFN